MREIFFSPAANTATGETTLAADTSIENDTFFYEKGDDLWPQQGRVTVDLSRLPEEHSTQLVPYETW